MKWTTRIWILIAGIAVAMIILLTVAGWPEFSKTALEAEHPTPASTLGHKSPGIAEQLLKEGLRYVVRYETSR